MYQYDNLIYPCVILTIQQSRKFVESFVRNKAERIAHDLAVPFYDELELNRSLAQVDLFAA